MIRKGLKQSVLLAAFGVSAVLFLCPKAYAARTLVICHGEFKTKAEVSGTDSKFWCDQHPYTVFEHCGDDNGVGGANPQESVNNLCGGKGIVNPAPAEGGSGHAGNHCGYSWFSITCTD